MNTIAKIGIAGFIFFAAAILGTILGGCTYPSKNLLPGIEESRENPIVEDIQYDSFLALQWDCMKQHHVPVIPPITFYGGCGWVPYDSKQPCIIRRMRGDKDRYEHEYAHCQGYADTWIPWMAKKSH